MRAELRLANLLAHPDNGGLRVLTGTDAIWRDVVVGVDESDLPAQAEGALAVLTIAPPAAIWQADALLRRVRDRGFSGLALSSGRALDPGSQAMASRIGLAVLQAERPAAFARACWQLLEGQDSLSLWYVRKVAGSVEYHAQGILDLLGHLAAGIGHGVALVDWNGVLQSAGPPLPPALLAATDFSSWVDTVSTPEGQAASVRVHNPSRQGLRLVFHGKDLGVTQLRALSIAAEVAMPAVAGRLLIDEVESVSDVSRSSGLLGDFVEQHGRPSVELDRRMLDRGWQTAGYHLGFRITVRHRNDPLELLRIVKSALTQVPVDSHATTRGRGVTGWLTFREPPTAAEVEHFVTRLRAVHTLARGEFPVATGIGSVGSGAGGLYSTLSEAADAAKLAANRENTGWFLHFDRLGLEQLLLAWTNNDTFVPAAQSLLAPLGGGELLRTLAAYLDHESGLAATAEALDLHRNTVSTRIQRIQSLLGIDLQDPQTRLAVHLATRTIKP